MVHRVTGELFFASSDEVVGRLSYATGPDRVVIDLSAAHLWDASSVAALDTLGTETPSAARPPRSPRSRG